ncbi:NADH-quinone oxidoreductase subunit C [Actinomadura sp. 1N219]|uniref:NADH-quinone oxidoreductase subunit C n=1 Tax=Actinomadura sp. 1N219 TaxID=3375152 RepID=UPI00378E23F1
MSAEALADAWTARFGDEITTEETFGGLAVGVSPELWLDALIFARDDLSCGFFDWLTGVDELDEGFAVVVHLYSLERRHHLLVRTRVPKRAPVLPTATGVFRGAEWHERETSEMFGVLFEGHPNLVPLLLPDGFEGHPLRKDFVLAARVAKPWPGAKEPGESGHGAPSRRRVRPPGVPDEGAWGEAAERAGRAGRRAEPSAGAEPSPGPGAAGPGAAGPEGEAPDA